MMSFNNLFLQAGSTVQGVILALIFVATLIAIHKSDFNYGYRHGRHTLKQLGKGVWEHINGSTKNGSVVEKMENFKKEIVSLSVGARLNFIDTKIFTLQENINNLNKLKQFYLDSLNNLPEELKKLEASTNSKFDGVDKSLLAGFSAESMEKRLKDVKKSFEEEYKIRVLEVDQQLAKVDKDIEVWKEKKKKLIEEKNNVKLPAFNILRSLKTKLISKTKHLRVVLVVFVLFLVEFIVMYDVFADLFQITIAKSEGNDLIHGMFSLIPFLGGLFMPVLLLGLYEWIWTLSKKSDSGVFIRILFNIFVVANLASIVMGTYFAVIIRLDENVDKYMQIMLLCYLFAAVFLSTYLLSKIKTKDSTHDFEALFIVPEVIISGVAIIVLSILSWVHSFFALASFNLKISGVDREINRCVSSKAGYKAGLEQFRNQYIENLLNEFVNNEFGEKVVELVKESKKNLSDGFKLLGDDVSTNLNKLMPSVDEKVKAQSKLIKKYEKIKQNITEGVHMVIKKRFKVA